MERNTYSKSELSLAMRLLCGHYLQLDARFFATCSSINSQALWCSLEDCSLLEYRVRFFSSAIFIDDKLRLCHIDNLAFFVRRRHLNFISLLLAHFLLRRVNVLLSNDFALVKSVLNEIILSHPFNNFSLQSQNHTIAR